MEMEYQTLGSSGLKVSSLAFGTFGTLGYGVELQDACKILRLCRNSGINFLDTSGHFCSGKADSILGEALQAIKWDRSSFVIATTVYPKTDWPVAMGHTRKCVIEDVKAAITRLKLSHVDIMFLTKPDTSKTPLEETLEGVKFIIRKGLAFYWGTSGWEEKQIKEACEIAKKLDLSLPIVNKSSYNMVKRAEVEEVADPSVLDEYGIGLVTWEPLSGGLLTGKYGGEEINPGCRYSWRPWSLRAKDLGDHVAVRAAHALETIAIDLGVDLPELAIAWCFKQSKVKSVIFGASKPEQIKENLLALKLTHRLTADVMTKIEIALAPILQK